MKEYVYLDTELVNSYLAQIDEGILTKVITGLDTGEKNLEEIAEQQGSSGNFEGGIPAVFQAGGSLSETESKKRSTVYSESNSELIETILDDYSLDVLISKLKEKYKLLESTEDWNDGNIITLNDYFLVYNFDLLKKSSERNQISLLVKESPELKAKKEESIIISNQKNKSGAVKDKLKKLNKEIAQLDPYANFDHVNNFATYANTLFPNSVVFKIGRAFCIGDEENLRINTSLLAFLSQTSRKVTLVGIVSSKKTKTLAPKENSEQLDTSTIAAEAPAIFTDIILESFNLAKIGDYFIRPIAIYFEDE